MAIGKTAKRMPESMLWYFIAYRLISFFLIDVSSDSEIEQGGSVSAHVLCAGRALLMYV
jgi:hypothetical protein